VAEVTPTVTPLAAFISEVSWSLQATAVPFNGFGGNPPFPVSGELDVGAAVRHGAVQDPRQLGS
jgi:hypothetical protein